MNDPGSHGPENDRIASLDLVRGVAVLGILAVNVAGFAGPAAAVLTPHFPNPASFLDEAAFATTFVIFEGKMRALFSLLFGASMALFIERAEAKGRDGDILQFRRLAWLALFGLAHYFLFWWGDILFLYAVAGMIALFARELSPRALLIAAAVIFAGWHIGGAAATVDLVRTEEQVRIGTAPPKEMKAHGDAAAAFMEHAAEELAAMREGFGPQLIRRLREKPFEPIEGVVGSIGETLPLVMAGMAFYRLGFFAGGWRRRTYLLALGGGLLGLAATLAALGWLWPRDFPMQAMTSALLFWMAIPHVMMALAYAGVLVRHTPAILATAPGRWLATAGRMAFSNYIGTTLLMTALFHGWGFGLAGSVGQAGLAAFVVLGWTAMLLGSTLWLARFRQGPLEWLWRSLVARRLLPTR